VLLLDTFFQSPNSGYNVGPYRSVQEALAAQMDSQRLRTMETKIGLPGMTLVY
jgi:hypothetical protein